MVRVARDDGVVAILVAAMALVLFGLAAIVVDLGFARQVRGEAQDAADAAALAGADALFTRSSSPNFSDALTAIRASASKNFGADPQLSQWTCPTPTLPGGVTWDGGSRSRTRCVQFGRQGGNPTSQVFVATPTKHVGALFGGVFGSNGVDISESAAAGSETNRLPSCALCVYGRLTVNAGGRVNVSGGSSLSSVDAIVPPVIPPADPSVVVTDGGQITFESPTPVPPSGAYSPDPPASGVPVADQDPLSPLFAPPSGAFVAPDQQFVCDGDRRPRSGTYQDLLVTDDCELRGGVYRVLGTLTVEADASLDADSATLVFDTASAINNLGEIRFGHARRSSLSIYWAPPTPLQLSQITPITIDGDVYALAGSEIAVTSPRVDVDGTLVARQVSVGPVSTLNIDANADSVRVQHSGLGLIQ